MESDDSAGNFLLLSFFLILCFFIYVVLRAISRLFAFFLGSSKDGSFGDNKSTQEVLRTREGIAVSKHAGWIDDLDRPSPVQFKQDLARIDALSLDSKVVRETDPPEVAVVTEKQTDTVAPYIPKGPPTKISIDGLLDDLGAEKWSFLNDVESQIESYVRGTKRKCLSIVEVDAHGPGRNRTHNPAPDDYVGVLIKFLFRKTWNGHALDSALSEPVARIVNERYAQFIVSRQDEIAAYLQKRLVQDKEFRHVLEAKLAEKLAKKGVSQGRAQLAHALSEAVQAALHSHVGATVQDQVSAAAHQVASLSTAAAATPVGHAVLHSGITTPIAHNIALALSHKVHLVVAKMLSTSMFQKIVGVLMKKHIVAFVGTFVAKQAVTHLGATKATLVVKALLIKLILAYIAVKLYRLPTTLGRDLAKGVRRSLETNFRPWTEMVLENVVKDLGDPTKFVEAAVSEALSDGSVEKRMDDVVGFPSCDYKDLQKNIGKGVKKVEQIGRSVRVRQRG